MATINYKGMELEEVTSDKPVAFPKGTKAICSFAVHYFVDAAKAVINEGALRAAYNYSMYARSIQTMKRRRRNYVEGATNAEG